MEKGREFQKNIYFCFIGYAKAFDCVDHNQLWKILKEKGIPDIMTAQCNHPYQALAEFLIHGFISNTIVILSF